MIKIRLTFNRFFYALGPLVLRGDSYGVGSFSEVKMPDEHTFQGCLDACKSLWLDNSQPNFNGATYKESTGKSYSYF